MIHPTAIVHPSAQIGDDVEIGPYCIVGEHVTLGARTTLLAHVVVNGRTTLGEDVVVHPFASVGASSQDRKVADNEVSYTKIGNRTIIREYASIHRATGDGQTTTIGDDCLLLAYTHVAHNCTLGNGVTMSNLAQIAGQVDGRRLRRHRRDGRRASRRAHRRLCIRRRHDAHHARRPAVFSRRGQSRRSARAQQRRPAAPQFRERDDRGIEERLQD